MRCGSITLKRAEDCEAVRAALTHEWSSGQTEGQIDRLKVIKRQMYGWANFELLKARFLHAARNEHQLAWQ